MKYFIIGFFLAFLLAILVYVRGVNARGDGEYVPVTICHATHSETNPFVEITIDNQGELNGHMNHAGDIIPAPESGCPTLTPTPTEEVTPTPTVTPTATPTPTETPTQTTNNSGGSNQGDGLGCAVHDCSTHPTTSSFDGAVVGWK